jgi:hypothetical protein
MQAIHERPSGCKQEQQLHWFPLPVRLLLCLTFSFCFPFKCLFLFVISNLLSFLYVDALQKTSNHLGEDKLFLLTPKKEKALMTISQTCLFAYIWVRLFISRTQMKLNQFYWIEVIADYLALL